MRYEDASGSFSSQAAGAPDARDDADVLPAGSRGPATGNIITGEGTITGAAGADVVTNGPGQIVALEGAGGSDSGEGGSLHVEGRFGEITMDSRGGYSYMANEAKPEGGRDVFRYTLADDAGARDSATLTIDIGRELEEIRADAQQIVPGPDGVVTLPPGVSLSDIQVVGRNLVINMPDGTQMVIIDGAIFVPQLVLGGVEVPASNLAALLIDAEPKPAAGTPLSSGGNFAVDVPPLDPGVPLGDLLPPTELVFEPPIFEDIGQFEDEEPEILIQPDGQPASVAAVDSVDEAGLPARNGNLPNEPAGSNSAADSETTTGTILIDSPDDPSVVTINGVAVTGVGQVIAGAFGNLTITSISDSAIGYSYTLADNTSGDATHDDFSVTVTDNDGDTATATLTINIVDDVPTARNDTDASVDGVATGNVITDAAPGDVGDSDTNAADTVGADNATLTSVSGAGGSDSTFSEGVLTVNGQFGTLTIDAQGNYTYTVNPNAGGGGVDVFTYTLTDGDGDTSSATLTITNPDLQPVTGPNALVRTDDDAVPGADGNPGGVGDDVDAENLTGTLSGSGGDGALTYDLLTTGAPAGFTYVDGPGGSVLVQQGGITVLTITVNASTGAYTVTQNAPIDHPAGGDENNLSFTINYTVTDVDGDSAAGTLTINVDDDTPVIAREDVSPPTLTVDETDLATNATGNFSTLFAVEYGADGPGTTSYAVTVVDGTDSGLIDVATGQSIFLFNNGGVVEGRVGGVGGAVAFTVSVDSSTGVVTLDQIRALDHPENPNPDDSVSPDADSIQFTVNAVDGDGDPVSQTINIGGNLVFDDDGPSLTNVAAGAGVLLDETTAGSPAGFPISATSASAVITATQAFGADGPAASGSVVYGLSLSGGAPSVASGLQTAIGDHAITLVQIDADTIEGQYNGTNVAFTIQMNADGTVTVTQNVPLEHLVDGPPGPAHDDPLDLNNLVEATITITDRDGDPTSATVAIGDNIVFEDDGPTAVDDSATQSAENAPITVNVLANDSGGADGTTNASVSFVPGTLTGTGNLVYNGDGTFTYTPSAGETGTVTFQYQIVDNDGDTATATVTLTLQPDSTPIVANAVAAVDDDGLAGGNPASTTGDLDANAGEPGATPSEALYIGTFSANFGADTPGTFSLAGMHGTTATVGTELVTYSWDAGTNTLTATGPRGVLFTVAINPSTGDYAVTLVDNVLHATGNNENDATAAITFTATDSEGDTTPGTLTITFDDDAPTAVNDSATQSSEDAPITVNVIANDAQGADGVSNSSISFVPGTLTGSGNLVYNGDGTFTYTPSAGETGTVTFQYQIVDADGDPSIATVTLTLQPDSTPIVSNAVAAVDDDGLAGGNPASTTGDLDANAGEPGATPSEALYIGTFVANFGADTPGTFSLAGMHGTTATVGTELVTYSWDAGTNTLTATGPRGVLFTVAINPSTGDYAVTLVDNVLHATGNNENDATAAITFTATDSEGDTTPGTLTITFDDDAPTAVNDSATQSAENAPITVNVIANDAQGADGVSNSSISFVPGTLSGAGVLVYNNNGTFTYTPAPGETGTVTFQYQIVDADGDPSIATVTLTLQPDSVPIVSNAVAAVDDDGLAGGNPASTTGDLDANAGEPGATPSEALYIGAFSVNFGGDTPGTFSLASMHGTTATVGTELVTYSWDAGTSTLTATGPRGVLFTVAINPSTGDYAVTLVDNVLHATGNNENDATAAITFTATDSDGDSQTGTLTITFDDDMPSNFSPVDLTDETGALPAQDDALVNNGTEVATRLLNDANNDGVGENFMGADGFGSLVFSGGTNGDPLLNGDGDTLTADDDPIFLFGFGTGVLTATTDPDNLDAAQVVFTVTLNPNTGFGSTSTYTIDFNREIDDGGSFVFDDFSTAPAGQNLWIGLDADGNDIDVDNNDSEDLLITGIPDAGTVNTSATDIGSNNQWIDEGEGIRLDFVVDVRRDGTQDEKDNTGYLFDGHYNVTDAGFTVMQTQGGGDASIHIRAVLDPDTGDIKTLTGTTVPIDESSIVVTGDSDGLYEIIDMGDGTFVITGLSTGAHVEFETVGGAFFNAVEISSAVGLANPEGGTFTGADFALGEFGFTSELAGNPVDFSLEVTASDADGDTATGTIDIVLIPDDSSTSSLSTASVSQEALIEDTSAFSLTASDPEQQRTMSAANNNSVLLGAIAAAGLGVGSAAAAHNFSPPGHDVAFDAMAVSDGGGAAHSSSVISGDVDQHALTGETKEAIDHPSGGSSAGHSDDGVQHSLTGGDAEAHGQAPTELLQGTEAPQSDPAQSTLTSAAVGMPSAEMLAAANENGNSVEGQAQSNAEVGRVLVDALAGGQGADIDAVIDAVANQGRGSEAALEALASHGAAAVSAWHTAGFAGFPGGHQAITMDPMLHHDAVHSAA